MKKTLRNPGKALKEVSGRCISGKALKEEFVKKSIGT